MSVIARLAVGWTGTGATGDAYRPNLDGLPLLGWQDVTGTDARELPPRLNASIVEATLADAAALATVAADPRCIVIRSWTVTTDANGVETVSADTALTKLTAGQRATALAWLQSQGFTVADFADINLAGMTRTEIAVALRAKLAVATKT